MDENTILSFSLGIFQIRVFVKFFKNICALSKLIQFDISEKGIYCQSLDDTHCVLFHLELKNDWFKHFYLKEGVKKTSISLECTYIYKVLNCANASTREIRFYHLENNQDVINIDIINWENENGEGENEVETESKTLMTNLNHSNKEFEIVLIDFSNENLSIPKISYDVDIILDSNGFEKILNEINEFGEDLDIVCNEENIILKTTGEMGKYSIKILEEQINEYGIVEDLNYEVTFGMNIINKVIKFLSLSPMVEINFIENNPTRILIPLDNPEQKAKQIELENKKTEKEKNSEAEDSGDDGEDGEDGEEKENFLIFHIAPKMK